MTNRELIADFWLLFERRCDALRDAQAADHPAYNELIVQLKRIHPGLWIEFSAEPGDRHFIITADGDKSLFKLVEAVVAAAPEKSDWQILALKPKLGFPQTTKWEGLTIRIEDVVFDPLAKNGAPEIGLRLYVPGIAHDDVDDAHNALLRVLDHGLGEKRFAEAVQYTEVSPLADAAEKYIPLTQLERYLDWRDRRGPTLQ
jgi:hypothetical protein